VGSSRDAIYPKFITIWIAISSLLLIIRSQKYLTQEISLNWEDKKGILRVVIVASTFVVYTVIIDFFGFLTPTFVFLVILMLIFGVRDWKVLVGISVAVPSVLYILVEKVLNFPLPRGRIF
jgi:hypothetical protein